MGKELATQRSPQGSIQDKPKDKSANTQINQTKKFKHKEQILKAHWKSKKYKRIPIRVS